MLILFSLIVMRMSGAVALNPILGRTNFPSSAKAAFVLLMSLIIYTGAGGRLYHEPSTMVEYGVMLVMELFFGFTLGFAVDLAVMVVRFSSSIMDYMMGLNMAQIYDPQYNTQMTITSGMYYSFLLLLFFAVDGHLRLFEIFYSSVRQIPFGAVHVSPQLIVAVLDMFQQSIVMGLQLAVPIIGMELVAETAVGILMRIIPQINVFVVNFQIKIIVGMLMLLFLFSPMADKLYGVLEFMFQWLQRMVGLMS